jgi:hypothetical protein
MQIKVLRILNDKENVMQFYNSKFEYFFFQFALVHYFTKVGSGEYYLEDLEETDCMAAKIKNRKNLIESSVSLLIRLVAWIRSSLLVKLQWQEHDYISEHRCGSVREL